jgi:excisionase family DNA binding protein
LPDRRIQEAVRLIFSRFRGLGSARQVLLSMTADQVHFPRPSDGKKLIAFEWTPIRYRNIISVLKNPFYAGACAYGKSGQRTALVEGRVRKTYGHGKPLEAYEVLLKDPHEGYIDWAEFERNQLQLAANAYGRIGGVKSGRGGRALLVGLLMCGRCGRRWSVVYTGRGRARPVYRCDRPNLMLGLRRCMAFGGPRLDAAIAEEILRAVAPMAIEAALEAGRRHMAELELQQARYEASLAEPRHAACDPDNRLIAAPLEKSWEVALQRAAACQARLRETLTPDPTVMAPDFAGLADDLESAWPAPGVSMRARQQLLRALVTGIIADVDDTKREVVLTIHWRGGQHSQLGIRKPKTGEHGCRTPEAALAVMQSMASRWSDEDIAASLNRMGMPTGQGKTWTAHRVSSVRRVNGIHAYRAAEKDGEWLTMSEAAGRLGVTNHRIRPLITDRILPAEQVVPGAPYQIRASDLEDPRVTAALRRKGRPYRINSENQIPMFPEA